MKIYNRDEIKEQIDTHRLIAILRGIPTEKLICVAEALYAGGVRLLEVTYAADSSRDAENSENIRLLAGHLGDRMMIGAGTVVTAEQVRLTKAAGGLFIISPGSDEEVIKETRRCGMVSIPGALTPTEILAASRAGADYVKLFPIGVMGAGYLKDVKAPLSHIKLLAVGGVNLDNMAGYAAAGAVGFGIGSGMFPSAAVAKGDYDTITELAKKYTEAAKNAFK